MNDLKRLVEYYTLNNEDIEFNYDKFLERNGISLESNEKYFNMDEFMEIPLEHRVLISKYVGRSERMLSNVQTNPKFRKLQDEVMIRSISNEWDQAIEEWKVIDYDISPDLNGVCACGKTGLHYINIIENKIDNINKHIINNIGSSCIERFGTDNMKHDSHGYKQVKKLINATRYNEHIEMKQRYKTELVYSRSAINMLYKTSVISKSDEEHLLKMFNQQTQHTPQQIDQYNYIFKNKIQPYAIEKNRKAHL